MTRMVFHTLFSLIAILWVLTPAGNELAAHSKSEKMSEKITQEKSELERIDKKIEQQQKKSRSAKRQEGSILDRLEKIDRQRILKKKELDKVNHQLVERNKEIKKLDADSRELQSEIEAKQGQVRTRIRVLYHEGRFGSLEALFGSSDYYDFLRRYYYLTQVSKKEGKLLRGYQAAVAELGPKQAALEKARADLLEYKHGITEKLNEIQSERKKKDRLLAMVQTKKSDYQRSIRELKESRLELQGLIQELEKERQALGRREAATGFARQRGFLEWPSNGRVIEFFGRQKHPKFDTYVDRNGIEIRGSQGGPIRSVYGGSVVYADWFRGYGLLVILDHGENYYSLYAHAAKLLVSVGDRVSRRQVIGEIGDTGLTAGSNLYFEIRRGAKAINPMKWLKKR